GMATYPSPINADSMVFVFIMGCEGFRLELEFVTINHVVQSWFGYPATVQKSLIHFKMHKSHLIQIILNRFKTDFRSSFVDVRAIQQWLWVGLSLIRIGHLRPVNLF